MNIYNKLIKVYPAEYFSISSTRTEIEEDDPNATTDKVIIQHTGVEVLKINKTLIVAERDNSTSDYQSVCDGIIAIDETNKFIGYFELKSACSTNNVLKARNQIMDSHHHLKSIASQCTIDMMAFAEKGIIVTQPISDENFRKARLRRKRNEEHGNSFSPYHFLLNLLKGRATIENIDMPLLHFNADQVISIEALL